MPWDFHRDGCAGCGARRLTMSRAANIVVDRTMGVSPARVTLTCARCKMEHCFRFSDGAVTRKRKTIREECR